MRSLFTTFFLARAQNQIGAHLSQSLRHLAAQANGPAGNDGDSAGEIEELFYGL